MSDDDSSIMIDLTQQEELNWLSRENKETESLALDQDDIDSLKAHSWRSVRHALAVGLAERDMDLYFDHTELSKIANEVLEGLEEIILVSECLPPTEEGLSLKSYQAARPQAAIDQVAKVNQRWKEWFGIPPQKELESHAEIVGNRTVARLQESSTGDLLDILEKVQLDTHRLGKRLIEAELGSERWVSATGHEIRQTISDPASVSDYREYRGESIAEEIEQLTSAESRIDSLLETLDIGPPSPMLPDVRQLIVDYYTGGVLDEPEAEKLLKTYVGVPQLPTQRPRPVASRPRRADTRLDEETESVAEKLRRLEELELSSESRDTPGSRLFFVLATKPDEQDRLEQLVIDGTETEVIQQFVEDSQIFDSDDRAISAWLWSGDGLTLSAASDMRNGDQLLFYTGEFAYTYRATVVDRIVSPTLSAVMQGTSETPERYHTDVGLEGVERPIVLLLRDVRPVDISSRWLHARLGYNRSYPTWYSVDHDRIQAITQEGDGVDELLSQAPPSERESR